MRKTHSCSIAAAAAAAGCLRNNLVHAAAAVDASVVGYYSTRKK